MFFALFSCFSFGQKNKNIQKQNRLTPVNLQEMNGHSTSSNSSLKKTFDDIKGTFQVQISNSNYTILLNQHIYNLIIEKRQQYQDVYVPIDDKSVLYLPSKSKIQDNGFKPLKTSIYNLKN